MTFRVAKGSLPKSGFSFEPVTVICYGKEEKWERRCDAIDFYTEGVLSCGGAECDRYARVLDDLYAGLLVCRDE